MSNKKIDTHNSPLSKSLLLIRHAKSSWYDLSQKDFDRPLNARGKKDAPVMAKHIKKEQHVLLDAIVSSPAKRAMETAAYFAEAFDIKKKHIIQIPKLYEPTAESFFNAIIDLSNDYKTVALFSHNNGITHFANELTSAHIDEMPTCSIFALHILDNNWKNFEKAEKEFWFFDYPKKFN